MSWFADICNRSLTTSEEYYDCVESAFYTKEELIFESLIFDFTTARFSNITVNWEPKVSAIFFGRCFTASNIGTIEAGKWIKVHLNTTIQAKYNIWLHDPDFFMLSLNPLSVPTLDNALQLYDAPLGGQQFLQVEKHQLLNRKNHQCKSYQEENSTFSECVTSYVYSLGQCKFKWDNDSNFEVCTKIEDILTITQGWISMLSMPLEEISK